MRATASSRAVLLGLMLLWAVGCAPPIEVERVSVVDVLPEVIGGEPMEYRVLDPEEEIGSDGDPLRMALVERGLDASSLRITLGTPRFTDRFMLAAWQVEGLAAQALVDPIIERWNFDDAVSWTEQVGSKTVTRAAPRAVASLDGADAIYLYAIGDVVISIVASDPSHAEEALGLLP